MNFHSHPALVRNLVGMVGALLLASVCLGTAVAPAHTASTTTVVSPLTV